ncbi:MAG: hypothetical protein RLY85_1780 [Bacteroidota bacterium]|jgi:hypothetical protein
MKRIYIALLCFTAFNSLPHRLLAEEETIYINENTFEKIDFQSEGRVRIDRFFLDALFDDLGTAALDNPPDMGDIPVDGGIGILLAAGVFYGKRRLSRKYHSAAANRPA